MNAFYRMARGVMVAGLLALALGAGAGCAKLKFWGTRKPSALVMPPAIPATTNAAPSSPAPLPVVAMTPPATNIVLPPVHVNLSPGSVTAAPPPVVAPPVTEPAPPATNLAPPNVEAEAASAPKESIVPKPIPVVTDRSPYRLRQGDPVIVFLRGIMPKDDQIEEIVDEKGYITLPYIDDIMAAGRTSSELEKDIQRTYIERQIYRSVSVNVVMPSQSYFIQGEVRQPQRFGLMTGTTLLQAIAAAGGYTEFADPKRVTLTRGQDVKVYNMREIERNPQKDVSVESGDVIRVPRSIF